MGTSKIEKIKQKLKGTDRDPQNVEAMWATIHTRKKDWTESYWRQNERRSYFAKQITSLPDISSVLELGCNVGANLYAIHNINPSIKLSGIDINESAISFGTDKFQMEKISADMKKMSLYDLSEIKDSSYDVVFTSAVLMHIPEEAIHNILENTVRIAKKFIVHLELHAFSNNEYVYYEKLSKRKFRDRWCRDYFQAYNGLVEEKRIKIFQIPPSISKLDISHSDIKVDTNALVLIECNV